MGPGGHEANVDGEQGSCLLSRPELEDDLGRASSHPLDSPGGEATGHQLS